MMRMIESRIVRRVVLSVLLLTSLAACTKWSPQRLPVEKARGELPGKIRVTRIDGSRIVLRSPAIMTDSLVGWAEGFPPGSPSRRFAIPLDSVQRIDRRTTDAGKTAALVGGVAGSLVLLALIVNPLDDIFEECLFRGAECR